MRNCDAEDRQALSAKAKAAERNQMMPRPWRERDQYRWMDELPRLAWAWELVRRDARYRTDYWAATLKQDVAAAVMQAASAGDWPMVRLRGP